MTKGSFGYGTTDRSRLNILGLEETVVNIHGRLAGVTLENLPYQEVFERYDRPHTFFYLDPPYYGMTVYRLNLEPKDFEDLAASLARLKGKFLMSLNDHPEVRRIFSGFKIKSVSLRYSAKGRGTDRSQQHPELLINN